MFQYSFAADLLEEGKRVGIVGEFQSDPALIRKGQSSPPNQWISAAVTPSLKGGWPTKEGIRKEVTGLNYFFFCRHNYISLLLQLLQRGFHHLQK